MDGEQMPDSGLPMRFFGKSHTDFHNHPDLNRKLQVGTKLSESFYCIWASVFTKRAGEYIL